MINFSFKKGPKGPNNGNEGKEMEIFMLIILLSYTYFFLRNILNI